MKSKNALFVALGEHEDELIRRFNEHSFWKLLPKLSDAAFLRYLFQLGCLSFEFVKWYEIAKLGLGFGLPQEVVRTIMRDEIPRKGFTHQDDRLHDFMQMGVAPEDVLSASKPFPETQRAIDQLYHLTRPSQDYQDLRVLVILRMAGELLIAETYRHVVREMECRFGIKPKDSLFYYPHFVHDQKGGGDTHSDEFDGVIETSLVNEHALETAKEAADQAFAVRYDFHDQFLMRNRVVATTKRFALTGVAMVACLLVAIGIGSFFVSDAPKVPTFVASANGSYVTFLRNCDRRLVEAYKKTGEIRYLEHVGTPEAIRAVWGDGP